MIRFFDVTLRDGLQSLSKCYTANQRFAMLKHFKKYYPSYLHVPYIEVGSTTNPKLLPQMKDSDVLVQKINEAFPSSNYKYGILCTNGKHLDQIFEFNPSGVSFVMSASNHFAQKNLRSSYIKSLEDVLLSIRIVHQHYFTDRIMPYLRIYISCALGCKYEHISNAKIIEIIRLLKQELNQHGLTHHNADIVLCDTYGIVTPESLQDRLQSIYQSNVLKNHNHETFYNVSQDISDNYLALHLHSDRMKSNQLLDVGIKNNILKYDVSMAGIGGCPYTDDSVGNLDFYHAIRYIQNRYPKLISPNFRNFDKSSIEFQKMLQE